MKFRSIVRTKNHITNRLQRLLVHFRTISHGYLKISISIFGFCKRLGLRAGSHHSVLRLTRPEFCIFCLQNLISYPELRFRVVYRCWDCSHSIRSENLSRSWCPDFFFNFSKKYFFDRSIFFWKKFGRKKIDEQFQNFEKPIQKMFDPKKFRYRKILIRKFLIQKSFFSDDRLFFWKSCKKKTGHQDRSKISPRIDWEHSQPRKSYSQIQFFVLKGYVELNDPPLSIRFSQFK